MGFGLFSRAFDVGLKDYIIPSPSPPRKDLRRALHAAPTDRFSVLQLSGQIFVEDGDGDGRKVEGETSIALSSEEIEGLMKGNDD